MPIPEPRQYADRTGQPPRRRGGLYGRPGKAAMSESLVVPVVRSGRA